VVIPKYQYRTPRFFFAIPLAEDPGPIDAATLEILERTSHAR